MSKGNFAGKLRFKRNKEVAMLSIRRFLRRVGTVAVVVLAACVLVDASVPRGWSLAGTKPAEYEVAN